MMSVGALFSWSAVAIVLLMAAQRILRITLARRTDALRDGGANIPAKIFTRSPGVAMDQLRFLSGGFSKLADGQVTVLVAGYWLSFVALLAAFLSLLTSAALWYVSASQ